MEILSRRAGLKEPVCWRNRSGGIRSGGTGLRVEEPVLEISSRMSRSQGTGLMAEPVWGNRSGGTGLWNRSRGTGLGNLVSKNRSWGTGLEEHGLKEPVSQEPVVTPI